MKSTKELRNWLEQKKGQRNQVESNLRVANQFLKEAQRDLRMAEKAHEVIKAVGLKTQEQLSYNISEITTLALDAVLDNPYDLVLSFEEKRDKTECAIYFERAGSKIDPYSGGGGPIDIAAFALRVASWNMQRPQSRNTLILDEPFKHLKGEEANRRMLEMVKQISEKLNLQIIMVSDERVSREATIEATDKLFEINIKRGRSKVTTD